MLARGLVFMACAMVGCGLAYLNLRLFTVSLNLIMRGYPAAQAVLPDLSPAGYALWGIRLFDLLPGVGGAITIALLSCRDAVARVILFTLAYMGTKYVVLVMEGEAQLLLSTESFYVLVDAVLAIVIAASGLAAHLLRPSRARRGFEVIT